MSQVQPDAWTLRQLARGAATAPERERWARLAFQSTRDLYDARVWADAQRGIGGEARAAIIERSLGLPAGVWLAPEGSMQIELAVSQDPPVPLVDGRPRALTAEELAIYGVSVGDRWWALPADGAAVEATVTGASAALLNECGGSWGVALHLASALPRDATVLAFGRGAMPGSWHRAAPPPVAPEAMSALEARVRRHASGRGLRDVEVTWAAAGDQAWFRAGAVVDLDEDAGPDPDLREVLLLDLVWDGHALTPVGEQRFWTFGEYGRPVAARDIDGDGRLESVWTDCARQLRAADGRWLASTTSRCCGC